MNELQEWVLVLAGSMFMLWFSLSTLIVGKSLYGSDASLLWACGFLSFMGIRGIANIILLLINKRNEY